MAKCRGAAACLQYWRRAAGADLEQARRHVVYRRRVTPAARRKSKDNLPWSDFADVSLGYADVQQGLAASTLRRYAIELDAWVVPYGSQQRWLIRDVTAPRLLACINDRVDLDEDVDDETGKRPPA